MLTSNEFPRPTFIEYREEYKNDLASLTLEWMEPNVSITPEDLCFITDPKGYVIDRGGFIILAIVNNKVIGTGSLLRISPTEYELAKLTITERYRGLGLGQLLIEQLLLKSTEIGVERLILYTSSKLRPALQLYKKLGFIENSNTASKYPDADIKMSLNLRKYKPLKNLNYEKC